jgi:hypothetical protein
MGRRTASPTVAKERATTMATKGELSICAGNTKYSIRLITAASRPTITI